MRGHRGRHACLGLIPGDAVILSHERFRFAGQLRRGDLGISLPDQLLLTGTRVTQHSGDVGALIGHLVVPLGDRLGLLGQHRTRPVRLIEAPESAASRNAALSTTIFWWMPSHVVAPAR